MLVVYLEFITAGKNKLEALILSHLANVATGTEGDAGVELYVKLFAKTWGYTERSIKGAVKSLEDRHLCTVLSEQPLVMRSQRPENKNYHVKVDPSLLELLRTPEDKFSFCSVERLFVVSMVYREMTLKRSNPVSIQAKVLAEGLGMSTNSLKTYLGDLRDLGILDYGRGTNTTLFEIVDKNFRDQIRQEGDRVVARTPLSESKEAKVAFYSRLNSATSVDLMIKALDNIPQPIACAILLFNHYQESQGKKSNWNPKLYGQLRTMLNRLWEESEGYFRVNFGPICYFLADKSITDKADFSSLESFIWKYKDDPNCRVRDAVNALKFLDAELDKWQKSVPALEGRNLPPSSRSQKARRNKNQISSFC